MKCPFCSAPDSKVIDSRCSDDGTIIRRRRECQSCEERFTSYERVEEGPVFVIKRDGRREEFERRKIFEGLCRACEKLPVSTDIIEKVTERVIFNVREKYGREVKTADIGEMILKELRGLDPVAYVRFVSVYRQFKNVDEFYSVLRDLLAQKNGNGAAETPNSKVPE